MITLNQNRERIKNGSTLILTSGLEVTCVNDRGYQVSITDPSGKRNLNFVTPSEIQSFTNFSEMEPNVSLNCNSTNEPELTTTNDSIASVNDLSDS
jgi:hypothetical protein